MLQNKLSNKHQQTTKYDKYEDSIYIEEEIYLVFTLENLETYKTFYFWTINIF